MKEKKKRKRRKREKAKKKRIMLQGLLSSTQGTI